MRQRALAHIAAASVTAIAAWLIYVFCIGSCAADNSTLLGFWACMQKPFAEFATFYSKELRGNLFAGYLTLGGFLLSLKTFIIVTMNDKLYQNETYQKKWKESRELDPQVGSLYQPLKRLNNLLFYAIGVSLAAAGAQFSIGFFDSWIAATICIVLAFCSFTLVVDCLVLIKANLDVWLGYIDSDAEQ